ncbi:MAG: tetratricopeptide repeat protein [Bacteroidales bacterium]|nr:tetratricopeptide repeat protein [Bacteroidales bacterium]
MRKVCFKQVLLLASLFCIFVTSNINAQDLQTAITLTRSEQYDEAEAAYNQLIQKEPNVSKNYFYLGENILLSYFADTISNSLKVLTTQAKEVYLKGVNADSLNSLNYIGLSKVAFYLGQDQEAAKFRLKAKKNLPAYKKVSKILNPKDYAFALAKLAESYIRNEKVDTSKALPLLREAITIDSKTPEIFIIAGDIYFLAKDGSNSIRNYNIANNLDKTRPTANMKIGSIYMKGRNLTAAIPYFEEAIKLNASYAPAYRELGLLWSMAGKYDKSKEYFKKYLEITKGNIPAKIRYVTALFYAKEYDEAVKNVEEIFSIDQKRTYLNRIAAYSSFEKNPPEYNKALAYMDKLFKDMPEDRIIQKDYTYYAKILLKKNSDYPKLVQNTEKLERDLTKNQEKYDAAKSAETKEKLKVQIDTLTNQIARSRKLIAADDVELDKAFQAYKKAYELTPDDKYLLNDVAVNLYNYKRFNESAKYFEKLIALGKNDANDYLQVGKAYNQGKNYVKADSALSVLVQKFPDNIQGYVWIANTYSAMDPDNNKGIARPKFEMVIQKARTDSVKYATELFNAYRFMGGDYFSQKNYAKAREYYYRIVNLSADNKEYKTIGYNSIGLTYYSNSEFDKAIEAYKKTLEIDPKNQNATISIKNVETARNNIVQAKPNEIKGIVKDVFGSPIASASVRVRDTAAEAWTNAEGKYSFEIPEGSEALIVSAKGYKSKEVVITKARIYNISLEQQ